MEHESRDSKGRWLKGTTGNAAGRGMTNRQRISEKLLGDLATVWETHGESVLERLALTEPGKLATIAYGLLPRDLFISFLKGATGNAARRPTNARTRIPGSLAAYPANFEEAHGESILGRPALNPNLVNVRCSGLRNCAATNPKRGSYEEA